jgi:FAD/FMN-containing dehydrogenase
MPQLLEGMADLLVLPRDGAQMTLGAPHGETPGYDLLGAFVGSEGCFGIALDCTVRLLPNPPMVRTLLADFMSLHDAALATSAIIARGILPAALEMMDGAAVRLVEASVYAAGYPTDCEAVLLVDLDGVVDGLDDDVAQVEALCREHGARHVRIAADAAERTLLWQGRKKAFGAMGRAAPHLVLQDAVVPRTQLPAILQQIATIGARHGVAVWNIFHAGDGNLHPSVSYDAADTDEAHRVHRCMTEIMQACIAAGRHSTETQSKREGRLVGAESTMGAKQPRAIKSQWLALRRSGSGTFF